MDEFKNILLTNQSAATGKQEFFLAGVLKPSEFDSNNTKIFKLEETKSTILGLNANLKIFGIYCLYVRAVILEKVLFILLFKMWNVKCFYLNNLFMLMYQKLAV